MSPTLLTMTITDANGHEMQVEAQPQNLYPDGWVSPGSCQYDGYTYVGYGSMRTPDGISYLDGSIWIDRYHGGEAELHVPTISSDRWCKMTYAAGFKTYDEAMAACKALIRLDFMVAVKGLFE